MISDIDLQTIRNFSRDATAFEQLTSLVERLIATAPRPVDAPPPPHQPEATLLAAIIHSSQDAIYTKTFTGIVTSWNPAAEKLYGYTADEIIGQSVNLFVPPELHAPTAALDKRVARGEAIKRFETVRLHKDGTPLDVSLTYSPIRAVTGDILGISVIADDISEIKRMRAALEDSERRMRNMLDTMQDGIFSVELPSTFMTYLNPAGEPGHGMATQRIPTGF